MLEILRRRALHRKLVVHGQRAEIEGEVGRIVKDDEHLKLRTRFADDVDILFVIVAVGILVFPTGFDHAVALFRALCVDVNLVDRLTGLVLNVQSKRLIPGFCNRFRFDRRSGLLSLGRLGRILRDLGQRPRRRGAGDRRKDHQQHENNGK